MIAPNYQHQIVFRTHEPQRRYQLRISEPDQRGKFRYLLKWEFETLRDVRVFLGLYFPSSQPLKLGDNQPFISFEGTTAAHS